MVILNASVALVLKAPSAIPCFFDLLNLVLTKKFEHTSQVLNSFYIYTYLKICSYDRVCHMLEGISNTLYCSSLALFFVFCYKFDLKFKHRLKVLFLFEKEQQLNAKNSPKACIKSGPQIIN